MADKVREFHPGWQKRVAGMLFRVVQGTRSDDDLVLQWCVDEDSETWENVPAVPLVALVTHFMYENETWRVPFELRGPKFRGGRKFLDTAVDMAVKKGHESAIRFHQAEARQARMF